MSKQATCNYTPREQVAANPKPFTSPAATSAREHADFTAAQMACHISVEDCWFGKKFCQESII